MKILLVTEDVPANLLGGAGKHAVLLGNTLIEAGHEVELLGCLGQDVGTNNDFQGKLHTLIDMRNIGLKEVALGIFNPMRKLYIARRIWKAIKQLPYAQFDVIHYHGHTAELGNFVPKSINFVHTLHDQGSECMTMLRFKNGAPCKSTSAFDCAGCATKNKPNFLQKLVSATAVKFHRYLARKAFTKHKAIFVSNFLQQRFKSVVANSNHINSVVIHNFTDVRAIGRVIGTADITKQKNTKPVVLIAGRIHETKGQITFLETITDDILGHIELRIAGDGPDFDFLKEKHEKRGVVFLGWQSQTAVYLETILADVCVVPSIWEEPCGTVSLEALALGKVVFSLARGGTPEQALYTSYQNQLRLFESISDMVKAFVNFDASNLNVRISFTADVNARLPSVLKIYTNKTQESTQCC